MAVAITTIFYFFVSLALIVVISTHTDALCWDTFSYLPIVPPKIDRCRLYCMLYDFYHLWIRPPTVKDDIYIGADNQQWLEACMAAVQSVGKFVVSPSLVRPDYQSYKVDVSYLKHHTGKMQS